MNLIKTYKIANRKKGQVEYGSQHGGKWMFKVGKWTKIMKVPGGKGVAHKIAEALHKSALRNSGKEVSDDSEKIDATCRRVIDRLCKLRTLADWRPDRDWWSNAGDCSVKMTYPNQTPPKGISAEDLAEEAPIVPAEVIVA